ncbi:MAG: TMEM43 family protein [Panacagrimonas sp.]
MADQYTVTTSQGWGSRIGGSIKGILVGLVMTVGAFPTLFWNEGRAVAREKALNEGAAAVISVDASRIDPQNEGRLVHLSGTAQTTDVVQDPEFGAPIVALRLIRQVSMYQWKENETRETRKKLGGGEETVTTYNYVKEWSDQVIDSGSFYDGEGHKNPGAMPFNAETFQAENVTVGAFRMNASQIGRTGAPRDLPDDVAITLPEGRGPAVRQGNTA